jgi:hypothetical protein
MSELGHLSDLVLNSDSLQQKLGAVKLMSSFSVTPRQDNQ